MKDLRNIGVDCVTFGQYMQPTRRHLKVRWHGIHKSNQNYRSKSMCTQTSSPNWSELALKWVSYTSHLGH